MRILKTLLIGSLLTVTLSASAQALPPSKTGLQAIITGPTDIAVGKTIILDASASRISSENAEYRWTIDETKQNLGRSVQAIYTPEKSGNLTFRLVVKGTGLDGKVEVVKINVDEKFDPLFHDAVEVENGGHIANETSIIMDSVAENTRIVIDVINMISSDSVEQARSIVEVQQGIDQISSVVHSNSATAEESAASSEELSAQAEALKSMIGNFRLAD